MSYTATPRIYRITTRICVYILLSTRTAGIFCVVRAACRNCAIGARIARKMSARLGEPRSVRAFGRCVGPTHSTDHLYVFGNAIRATRDISIRPDRYLFRRRGDNLIASRRQVICVVCVRDGILHVVARQRSRQRSAF